MRNTDRHPRSTTWTLVSPAAGLLCLMAGASGFAQTAAAPTAGQTVSSPAKPPLRTLYRHFLGFQNYLDRVADTHEKQGKDGSAFRSYNQKQLGFTDAQFTAVRQAAARLEPELREQDAKAKPIIDAIRAQRLSAPKSAAGPPPLPPAIATLQNERDGVIDGEVARLKAELGPEAAAKLDTYLQHVFAANVKVQKVPPHPAHGVFYHAVPSSAPAGPSPARKVAQ